MDSASLTLSTNIRTSSEAPLFGRWRSCWLVNRSWTMRSLNTGHVSWQVWNWKVLLWEVIGILALWKMTHGCKMMKQQAQPSQPLRQNTKIEGCRNGHETKSTIVPYFSIVAALWWTLCFILFCYSPLQSWRNSSCHLARVAQRPTRRLTLGGLDLLLRPVPWREDINGRQWCSRSFFEGFLSKLQVFKPLW